MPISCPQQLTEHPLFTAHTSNVMPRAMSVAPLLPDTTSGLGLATGRPVPAPSTECPAYPQQRAVPSMSSAHEYVQLAIAFKEWSMRPARGVPVPSTGPVGASWRGVVPANGPWPALLRDHGRAELPLCYLLRPRSGQSALKGKAASRTGSSPSRSPMSKRQIKQGGLRLGEAQPVRRRASPGSPFRAVCPSARPSQDRRRPTTGHAPPGHGPGRRRCAGVSSRLSS
jgi:hypothetical protein